MHRLYSAAIVSSLKGADTRMKKSSVITIAFLCLISGWVSAMAAGDYEGKKWAFVDSKAVLEAAKAITLSNYPDCDEATVDKHMVRVYRPDGTGECQDETYEKVLTEKGKRG